LSQKRIFLIVNVKLRQRINKVNKISACFSQGLNKAFCEVNKPKEISDSGSKMKFEFYHLNSSVCQNGDFSVTGYFTSLSSIKLMQYENSYPANPSQSRIRYKKVPGFDE